MAAVQREGKVTRERFRYHNQRDNHGLSSAVDTRRKELGSKQLRRGLGGGAKRLAVAAVIAIHGETGTKNAAALRAAMGPPCAKGARYSRRSTTGRGSQDYGFI